jgi:PH (Pleckstrin Homology) domain-containing protein
MSTSTFSAGMPRRGVKKYLHSTEEVEYRCRRHPVVISSVFSLWLVSVVVCLALEAIASWTPPALHVGGAGVLVLVLGTLFLGWRGLEWWKACYVFTNERVLLIEGLVSRVVIGIPFRLVIDTTYRRTLPGRLLDYGDVELNLSGRPSLRTLRTLPKPDRVYNLILSLLHGCNDVESAEVTTEGGDGEVRSRPDAQPSNVRCLCCSSRRCGHETVE